MCVTPITLKKNTADSMTVGCGRCIPCHLKYCNQWAFRFKIHANQNPVYWCVTLTYDGKNLPYVKGKNGKIYQTLVRAHASNFFKTLRNNHNKTYKKCVLKPKISYLIAGEYGDKFKRPHYHALIFGATPDDILLSWNKGSIHFGESNLEATVNYALKYSLKSRIYNYQKDSYYERPFINVSKGIGESLIVQREKIFPLIDFSTGELKTHTRTIKCITNSIPELIDNSGVKLQLPRYYTKKLQINIDTDKFKSDAIDKHRKMEKNIYENGKTFSEFSKEYHKYLYFMKKDQHYNNEIITNLPAEIIAKYQK